MIASFNKFYQKFKKYLLLGFAFIYLIAVGGFISILLYKYGLWRLFLIYCPFIITPCLIIAYRLKNRFYKTIAFLASPYIIYLCVVNALDQAYQADPTMFKSGSITLATWLWTAIIIWLGLASLVGMRLEEEEAKSDFLAKKDELQKQKTQEKIAWLNEAVKKKQENTRRVKRTKDLLSLHFFRKMGYRPTKNKANKKDIDLWKKKYHNQINQIIENGGFYDEKTTKAS